VQFLRNSKYEAAKSLLANISGERYGMNGPIENFFEKVDTGLFSATASKIVHPYLEIQRQSFLDSFHSSFTTKMKIS